MKNWDGALSCYITSKCQPMTQVTSKTSWGLPKVHFRQSYGCRVPRSRILMLDTQIWWFACMAETRDLPNLSFAAAAIQPVQQPNSQSAYCGCMPNGLLGFIYYDLLCVLRMKIWNELEIILMKCNICWDKTFLNIIPEFYVGRSHNIFFLLENDDRSRAIGHC